MMLSRALARAARYSLVTKVTVKSDLNLCHSPESMTVHQGPTPVSCWTAIANHAGGLGVP